MRVGQNSRKMARDSRISFTVNEEGVSVVSAVSCACSPRVQEKRLGLFQMLGEGQENVAPARLASDEGLTTREGTANG